MLLGVSHLQELYERTFGEPLHARAPPTEEYRMTFAEGVETVVAHTSILLDACNSMARLLALEVKFYALTGSYMVLKQGVDIASSLVSRPLALTAAA